MTTIESLRAALAAGPTPGPWKMVTDGSGKYEAYVYATKARYWQLPGNPSPVKVAWCPQQFDERGEPQHRTDAAYIAAACNAAPDLLAELDRLTAEVERQKGVIGQANAHADHLGMTLRDIKAERDTLRADAERYRKWRAAFTSERDEPLMHKLADAWEPEAVDAAIDAALKEPS